MKKNKFTVFISDEAEADIDSGFIWYEIQKKSLGLAFIRNIKNSINKIRINPYKYPKVKYGIRKHLIEKFPYCVYYTVDIIENSIKVIAVFHNSRNPNVWKKRV